MKPISRTKISVIKKREGEPWIYSYSDLVTNLLAFFMVLFIVMNSPDKARKQMEEGLKDYVEGKKSASQDQQLDHYELKSIISQFVKDHNLENSISLKESKTGLDLTFQGALLFDSATADIKPEAEFILDQMSLLLRKLPPRYGFDVEGHADFRPISSKVFPSNWELSSARAGSVVRYMSQRNLSPSRFRAIGYGSTQLIPDTPADHPSQRRVVIKIESWIKEKEG